MIPKVVHQIWIGPKPAPNHMMRSWQRFCEAYGWAYRVWTDYEDSMFDPLRPVIDAMDDYAGKADCMRYLILDRFGGVYADADTVLIRPLDDALLVTDFCCYEHEDARPGLVANTVLGFQASGSILRDCIEAIASRPIGPAFSFSGPYLISEAISLHRRRHSQGADGRELRLLPSRLFYPVHWTACPAPCVQLPRNGRPDPSIYAKHVWSGSEVARVSRDKNEVARRVHMIEHFEKVLGIDDASLSQLGW